MITQTNVKPPSFMTQNQEGSARMQLVFIKPLLGSGHLLIKRKKGLDQSDYSL